MNRFAGEIYSCSRFDFTRLCFNGSSTAVTLEVELNHLCLAYH